MYGETFSDMKNEQSLLKINYMDWHELTYMRNTKFTYYLKNDDDYSDLHEDHKFIYLTNNLKCKVYVAKVL